jgi:hypothetical protein
VSGSETDEGDVRLNVKLSGREFPLLVGDISRIPKGPRRTHRLAHLATLGLCWERTVGGQDVVGCGQLVPREGAAVDSTGSPGYRSRLDSDQLAALLADECES